MIQQTLFGGTDELNGYTDERKEIIKNHLDKVEAHNKKVEISEDFEERDKDYCKELSAWREKCEKEVESQYYWTIDYYGSVNTDGTKDERITSYNSFERLNKGVEESYGGCWGGGGTYETKEEIREMLDELIEDKTNLLSRPYDKDKADDYIIRGIKKENIKVFMSEKTIEFIERVGELKLKDYFWKKWDNIKEQELTKELLKKIDKYNELDKEKSELNSKIWDLNNKLHKAIDNIDKGLITSEKIGQMSQDLIDYKIKHREVTKEFDELREEL